MNTSLEILLSPAELAFLPQRDLRGATCVVFDVLRATSSMLAALANGAEAVLPVSGIPEALSLRERDPQLLLAGERGGRRILARQTGSVDFDLGNSPREFTADRVRGRVIAMTTTNGTRAFRACQGAQHVLAGGFVNLEAMTAWITLHQPRELLLVCSGTGEQAAFEDALAAGALADRILGIYRDGHVSDAMELARQAYQLHKNDLSAAMSHSRNGRRLLEMPELRDDVAFCLDRNRIPLIGIRAGDRIIKLKE